MYSVSSQGISHEQLKGLYDSEMKKENFFRERLSLKLFSSAQRPSLVASPYLRSFKDDEFLQEMNSDISPSRPTFFGKCFVIDE